MITESAIADRESPWVNATFVISPVVVHIHGEDQVALFCERTQTLHQLNETANLIWQAIGAGLSPREVSGLLSASGVDPQAADTYVAAAVSEWLKLGFMAPHVINRYHDERPAKSVVLRIEDTAIVLRLFDDANSSEIMSALGHLVENSEDAATQIDVVSRHGSSFFFLSGTPVGMRTPQQVVPELKALATAEYVKSVKTGFVAHGALLSANGRRILLSGQPGAGKTTLALALAASGFAYGGDDIVHVSADGFAVGIPFPAASKSGSWKLLAPFLPDLETLSVHDRADGVSVRYVVPQNHDRDGPRPLDLILFLDRRTGVGAHLSPLSLLDALCGLLEGGWSESHSTEARTIEALSRNLSRAKLHRLTYNDLSDAVALIEGLVNE